MSSHHPHPAQLITAALATHRLTRLITTDTITEPLRERLWDYFPPEDHGIGYIPTCPHCASIYAAAATAVLTLLSTHARTPAPLRIAANLLLHTLALSGATSLLHEYAPPPANDATGWDPSPTG